MSSVFSNLNELLKKAFWLFDCWGLKAALSIIIMEAKTGHFCSLLSSKAEHWLQSHKMFSASISRVLFLTCVKKLSAQTLKNVMDLNLIKFSLIHEK